MSDALALPASDRQASAGATGDRPVARLCGSRRPIHMGGGDYSLYQERGRQEFRSGVSPQLGVEVPGWADCSVAAGGRRCCTSVRCPSEQAPQTQLRPIRGGVEHPLERVCKAADVGESQRHHGPAHALLRAPVHRRHRRRRRRHVVPLEVSRRARDLGVCSLLPPSLEVVSCAEKSA